VTELPDTGQAKRASAACTGIFHGYQQLLRIATQLTTPHQHHIDLNSVFARKDSLRNGVTACFELSPVSMTF
jgi:hypothetical protein